MSLWESMNSRLANRVALTVGTRVAPGVIFIVFGADEFVNHSRNVHSFALYGLPSPSVFSYAIGTLEIVGGLALLSGIALLPAAVALAGDMVGAIVVSGIALGELVSLTLAPVMLAAMLVLIACELSARGSVRPRGRRRSVASGARSTR
jgi:putative oxidoreductase